MKIEFHKWLKNGDHPDDYKKPAHSLQNGVFHAFSPDYQRSSDWEGQVVRRFRHPSISGDTLCGHCKKPMNDHGYIERSNRPWVCPGDFVARLDNGRYFSVSEEWYEHLLCIDDLDKERD